MAHWTWPAWVECVLKKEDNFKMEDAMVYVMHCLLLYFTMGWTATEWCNVFYNAFACSIFYDFSLNYSLTLVFRCLFLFLSLLLNTGLLTLAIIVFVEIFHLSRRMYCFQHTYTVLKFHTNHKLLEPVTVCVLLSLDCATEKVILSQASHLEIFISFPWPLSSTQAASRTCRKPITSNDKWKTDLGCADKTVILLW